MSVTTTSDEKLDDARNHILSAQKLLMEALHPDTWGHDDYDDEFIEKILEVSVELIKLSRKLK